MYDYNINDVYNGNDAKTTMFVNGYNWDCIYDPEYVSHIRAMYENGHLIASHTWSHVHLPSVRLLVQTLLSILTWKIF